MLLKIIVHFLLIPHLNILFVYNHYMFFEVDFLDESSLAGHERAYVGFIIWVYSDVIVEIMPPSEYSWAIIVSASHDAISPKWFWVLKSIDNEAIWARLNLTDSYLREIKRFWGINLNHYVAWYLLFNSWVINGITHYKLGSFLVFINISRIDCILLLIRAWKETLIMSAAVIGRIIIDLKRPQSIIFLPNRIRQQI